MCFRQLSTRSGRINISGGRGVVAFRGTHPSAKSESSERTYSNKFISVCASAPNKLFKKMFIGFGAFARMQRYDRTGSTS
jgi:hypothetical protein